MLDPTSRFGPRADAYARHRPAYADSLARLLRERCALGPGAAVADVGSGTGILTAQLLDAGFRVFAVEPNAPMRAHAEAALIGTPGFISVDGRAEATGLADGSVALAVAAQAFHWFDPAAFRREVIRILEPEGWAALIWNVRATGASEFMGGYEAIIREFAIDPVGVTPHEDPKAIATFFGTSVPDRLVVPHHDRLDREGLVGRACSASYMPPPGHARHEGMLRALESLYGSHANEGAVTFAFETRVHLGRPGRADA